MLIGQAKAIIIVGSYNYLLLLLLLLLLLIKNDLDKHLSKKINDSKIT